MKRSHIALLVSGAALLTFAGYYFGLQKNMAHNETLSTEATSTQEVSTATLKVNSSNGVTTGKVTQPVTSKPSANYAYIGKRVVVGNVGITPIKISYDSRCPKDVRCIQAGTVDLGVLLEEGKLSQNAIITLGKPFMFAEKMVTLTSVYPERVSTKTLKDSDYKFLFTVK